MFNINQYRKAVVLDVALTDIPTIPAPAKATLGQSWTNIPFGTHKIPRKQRAVKMWADAIVHRRPHLPTTKTQNNVPGIAINPLRPTVKNMFLPTWPKYWENA